MACYVLLEFDDNTKAKNFIVKVNGEYAAIDMPARGFRVRALWGKPTKFCECTGGRKGMFPYRRAEKSGWWVHSECGRPNVAWGKNHNHWFSALGRNLLPKNKDYVPGEGKEPGDSRWGYL